MRFQLGLFCVESSLRLAQPNKARLWNVHRRPGAGEDVTLNGNRLSRQTGEFNCEPLALQTDLRVHILIVNIRGKFQLVRPCIVIFRIGADI
jgi:hypothetical protein